jgi:uncharacterized protein
MRQILLAISAFIILLVPQTGHADFPRPAGFVNDYANVIQAGTREKLEGSLDALEKKTGVEIAVVTVKSLDGRPIEDYAVDLYQTWGIGKKDKDEGALILVAPEDRKVRIEVGYGLEGALNDAMAGRIIREAMIPFFKEGDFTRGIVAGSQAVAAIALKEKGYEPGDLGNVGAYARQPAKKKSGPLKTLGQILILVIMIYLFIRHPWLFLFFLASGGGRGGGGRSSGFSGGFGGFGGGMSGGGGASGSW